MILTNLLTSWQLLWACQCVRSGHPSYSHSSLCLMGVSGKDCAIVHLAFLVKVDETHQVHPSSHPQSPACSLPFFSSSFSVSRDWGTFSCYDGCYETLQSFPMKSKIPKRLEVRITAMSQQTRTPCHGFWTERLQSFPPPCGLLHMQCKIQTERSLRAKGRHDNALNTILLHKISKNKHFEIIVFF